MLSNLKTFLFIIFSFLFLKLFFAKIRCIVAGSLYQKHSKATLNSENASNNNNSNQNEMKVII